MAYTYNLYLLKIRYNQYSIRLRSRVLYNILLGINIIKFVCLIIHICIQKTMMIILRTYILFIVGVIFCIVVNRIEFVIVRKCCSRVWYIELLISILCNPSIIYTHVSNIILCTCNIWVKGLCDLGSNLA